MSERRLLPTAAIPVVEQLPVAIDAAEQRRLTAIADRLPAADPALGFSGPFGADVTTGCLQRPSVVLEDHSTISLFSRHDTSIYDYRALALAGEGDVVVVGTPRNAVFEGYYRDLLRLGRVDVEALTGRTPRPARSLASKAAGDRELVARLAARARQAGSLTIVPYMGTGGVWRLAAEIATSARCPIRVAAPPPRLAARVNDKAWFAQRVADVLGLEAAPPSETVFGHAALAARVACFARRYPSIAVKLPDSASSAGNLVLAAATLSRLSLRSLADEIASQLAALGWMGSFPLVVTAWEKPVLVSPSVQLWIPHPDDGLPMVEGVFDQTVIGPTAVFSGAVPSSLPMAWQLRAAEQAVRLATLFQALGYFGRCSFDAVLTGQHEAAAELHWIECNGRWGGVSTALTLANRLAGDWTTAHPVIIDHASLEGRGCPLEEMLEALQGELYQPPGPVRGAVILAPGRIERGSGFQVMVLDTSVAEARARAMRVERRLLHLLEKGPAPARIA